MKIHNGTLVLFTAVMFVLLIIGGCSQGRDAAIKRTEEIQGITMVSLPAGSFQMGHDYKNDSSLSSKVNVYYSDEQPVHTVTLSAFQMSVTEITQGQYT